MAFIGGEYLFFAVLIYVAQECAFRQKMIQDLDELVLVAAAVEADIENQLVSPLVHKLLHGSDGLVGTAGHKILDLHIANGAIDQIAFRDLRIHLVSGDIEGHRLPLTHNGNGHLGTRFSLDAVCQVGHGELLHALPVHLNDHILRLHAGLLCRAALHHGLDHKAAGLRV